MESGGGSGGETREPVDLGFPLEATHVMRRRYLAHLADGCLYLLIAIVPLVLAAMVSNLLLAIAVFLWLFPGPVVYYVITQRKTGRSPAKRYFDIRVVDADGNVPSTGAIVRRSVLLPLDNTYVFALISFMFSPGWRRLGDRWGGTYVIDG